MDSFPLGVKFLNKKNEKMLIQFKDIVKIFTLHIDTWAHFENCQKTIEKVYQIQF